MLNRRSFVKAVSSLLALLPFSHTKKVAASLPMSAPVEDDNGWYLKWRLEHVVRETYNEAVLTLDSDNVKTAGVLLTGVVLICVRPVEYYQHRDTGAMCMRIVGRCEGRLEASRAIGPAAMFSAISDVTTATKRTAKLNDAVSLKSLLMTSTGMTVASPDGLIVMECPAFIFNDRERTDVGNEHMNWINKDIGEPFSEI